VANLPEAQFKQWFRKLDKDGDGKIDMIEMAHTLHRFADQMPENKVTIRPSQQSSLRHTIKPTVWSIIKGD